jgi:hypothetical protein
LLSLGDHFVCVEGLILLNRVSARRVRQFGRTYFSRDDTKLILQLIEALRDGQLETHAVLKELVQRVAGLDKRLQKIEE